MSTTEQLFFQPLLDCLQQSGVDIHSLRLKANVELLDAGQRLTTYGDPARAFVPVAKTLELQDPLGEVVAYASYDNRRVHVESTRPYGIVDAAFDKCIGLHGLFSGQHHLIPVIGRLMRDALEQYGSIMGTPSGIYPRMDNDTEQIEKFQATRFSLEIDFYRTIQYLHLDDQLLSSLWECADSEVDARMYELRYCKHMLEVPFVAQPCTREQYDRVMLSYRSGRGSGLDFSTYYKWYRRSEALFDTDGNVEPETAKAMSNAVLVWHQSHTGSDDVRSSISYWANRNFEIHPMHKDRVERFIDSVLQTGIFSASIRPDGV